MHSAPMPVLDHWTLSHGSCFCSIEGRLLQLHRRESQTSCKCCSTSDHCDSEVRASSVTADDLHWLIVPHRLQYKLAVTVHRCLEHRTSRYLADRLLCACVWSSQSAASTICQASSTLFHEFAAARLEVVLFVLLMLLVNVWNSLPDDLLLLSTQSDCLHQRSVQPLQSLFITGLPCSTSSSFLTACHWLCIAWSLHHSASCFSEQNVITSIALSICSSPQNIFHLRLCFISVRAPAMDKRLGLGFHFSLVFFLIYCFKVPCCRPVSVSCVVRLYT